jgi:DNA-binding transcriptional ArsR family regulator
MYKTFGLKNMTTKIEDPISRISELFDLLSPTPRVKILLALGSGESCVCHLEAKLGLRQAYLSQHLMALRGAELIKTRREGRFIFYSLANPALLDLIHLTAQLAGVVAETPSKTRHVGMASCHCPTCSPVSVN